MIENNLPAIHPGEFLREMLAELGVSQVEFARRIGVSPMRVSHVIGYLDNRLHALVFGDAGNGVRVISFRKANSREGAKHGFALTRN